MAFDIFDQTFYTHNDVESEYLEERQLQKESKWPLFLLLGISGMISGQFFGWNIGVGEVGFWGMLIALFFVTGIYICFAFTVAELSAALPEAGGIYAPIRYAFGPFIGFLSGILMLSFYIIMSAMLVLVVSDYLGQLIPSLPIFVWWITLYTIFTIINIAGLKWVLRTSTILTLFVLGTLIVFYVAAVITGSVTEQFLVNLSFLSFEVKSWLPRGPSSLLIAFPYALWFYLSADLITITVEESQNTTTNLPKTMLGAILFLFLISLLTLIIVTNLSSNLVLISGEENPIAYGFSYIFSNQIATFLFSITALLTTLLAMIYAYGRILFSLSRSGYLPRWISRTSSILRSSNRASRRSATDNVKDDSSDVSTNKKITSKFSFPFSHISKLRKKKEKSTPSQNTSTNKRKTPSRSLIVGTMLGLICVYFMSNEESIVQSILFATPLLILMICHILVFSSYIVLKREQADLVRPYNSPLGVRGAWAGLISLAITFLSYILYTDPNTFIYLLLTIGIGVIYFGLYGRKKLISQAPMEEKWLKISNIKRVEFTRKFIMPLIYLGGIILVLSTLYSYLFSPPKLECTPNCMGMNLAGRYLENAELAGVNLIEANLRGANLSGANLQEADLSGAILVDVNLENADLTGAKLLGVNFTRANLGGVLLHDTDMRGSDLIDTNLTQVDFRKAKLRGVFFSNSKLVGANLSKTNLAGVTFIGANLNGANLRESNLNGALLSKADLSGAQLQNSELSGAWLNSANLIGADLSRANLDGASLIAANLASANLFESNLIGSILVGADLNGANLKSANLSGALLTKEQLRQNSLDDPVLKQLNEIQLAEALKDTLINGAYLNQETIFPEQLNKEVTLLQTSQSAGDQADLGSIKVGILHSLTGPLAISEIPIKDATLLAIDEINQAGGILGKQLIPVIENGGSDWQLFAEKAIKLLVEDEVVVIFGGWSGASRQAMRPILESLDSLLFYPSQYEGQETSTNIIYTGAEPSQQLIPAIEYLLRQRYQRFFLLGSNMLYSKTAHTIIEAQLTTNGATVAGESFSLLGEQDFSTIVEEIRASKADVVINTLSGDSNIAFFQEFNKSGLTSQQLPVMSLTLTEEEIRQMPFETSRIAGHLVVSSYFQTLATPENEAFVKAYKTAYGSELVTSEPIHAGYLGVYLWKAMVKEANATELDLIRNALTDINKSSESDLSAEETQQVQILAPGGTVQLDIDSQHTYKFSRIGIIRDDGLVEEIFSSNEAIKPDPFLLEYEWTSGLFSREGGR